jgi:hypothetical protein
MLGKSFPLLSHPQYSRTLMFVVGLLGQAAQNRGSVRPPTEAA